MNDVLIAVLLAALGGLAALAHYYPQIFKAILLPVMAIPAVGAIFTWGFESGRNSAYVILLKHTGQSVDQADAAFQSSLRVSPLAVILACIGIAIYVQILDFVATAAAKRIAAEEVRSRRS